MEHTVRHVMRNAQRQTGVENEKDSKAQGADFHQLREFNRQLILNYVRTHGPIPRTMIAQELGLSRTTVSNIMAKLLQENLVQEGHFLDATSKGGRRPILVHFNADAGRVVGINVGRTQLTMILTNLSSEIIVQHNTPFKIEQATEAGLAILIGEIQAFVEMCQVDWNCIVGIGLATPTRAYTTRQQPDGSMKKSILHWNDERARIVLYEAFKKPLYIENDANLGTLAEHRCGVGQECNNMAYITLDLGIGSGFIINGQIYRGHSGNAGEIGHIILDKGGPQCVCGKRGCLEAMAGAGAIIATSQKTTGHNGQPDAQHSQKNPFNQEETTQRDIMEVIKAAQNGDANCIAAFEQAGTYIGQALAHLINLLNPSLIVIDGSVVAAGDLLLKPLRKAAEAASMQACWESTRIIPGVFGTIANALGAAILVIDAAFTLPAISSASPLPPAKSLDINRIYSQQV